MKKVLCKTDMDYRLYLTSSYYTDNGRIYLGLLWFDEDSGDYELWDDLTINLSDFDIESENIVFINNDISDSIFERIEETGLLCYLDTIQENYAYYRKCYVNKKVMNKYLND